MKFILQLLVGAGAVFCVGDIITIDVPCPDQEGVADPEDLDDVMLDWTRNQQTAEVA